MAQGQQGPLPAKARAVSVTFQQLCGFVAIRQTQDSDEVLRKLLLHCFELYPAERFSSPARFAALIDDRFGLQFTDARIQAALDSCRGRTELIRTAEGVYGLTPKIQSEVRRRVLEATELEERVRTKWIAEVSSIIPDITSEVAWSAFQVYVGRMFRQHGLQTLSLVDPSIEVPTEFQASVRGMLSDSVKLAPAEHREALGNLLEAFFLGIASDPDRVAYVVQIADSLVSYYSLTVQPEVADHLRSQLRPLVLFLDTNVLFGLIGLDDAPHVVVAQELIKLISEHQLPFRLRYHTSTERELRQTLEASVGRLLGYRWSPHISRLAAKLPQVSTIQRLYHERNAAVSITPETFFAPFEHVDVLVQEAGIKVYREPSETARAYLRSNCRLRLILKEVRSTEIL
jgi:hypothetical protein